MEGYYFPDLQNNVVVNSDLCCYAQQYPEDTGSGCLQIPSWSGNFIEEDKTTSVSKSHSQAEKRRRDRINAQLASLRKLIPKSDKMDKAALLGTVIDQVKELKRKASEIGKSTIIPTEVDEVTIECHNTSNLNIPTTSTSNNTNFIKQNIYIKASVSCDDRPELFPELNRVLKSLRLTTVRADMSSVGGRIKSILVLCSKDGEESVCLSTLQQSLKVVLSRIACSSMASNCRIRSKRQRFFLPYQNPP